MHGNLAAYKVYVRPMAHQMYGSMANPDSKHRQNVHELLRILLVHGTSTTWEMARTIHRDRIKISVREKEYRRLLIGRVDRNRHSGGIVDLGLVVNEGRSPVKKRYNMYRLSLYGILYCIEVLEPTEEEIDKMAASYANLVPKIFGKWKTLKSVLGYDTYNLRMLAQGILLDTTPHSDNIMYDLMSFLRLKYRRHFESISEEDLSEQTSYWFYTFLLYGGSDVKLKKILKKDAKLARWYKRFVRMAKKHYSERFHRMNRIDM